MSAPYEIQIVEYVEQYRLRVGFADGSVRLIDLGPKLAGPVGPMFEPLRDAQYFALAVVDAETGTVVWPNGADLAPDAVDAGAFDAVNAA